VEGTQLNLLQNNPFLAVQGSLFNKLLESGIVFDIQPLYLPYVLIFIDNPVLLGYKPGVKSNSPV